MRLGSILELRPRAGTNVKKISAETGGSPVRNSEGGLPQVTSESPRLTARFHEDELEALAEFAKAHRWRTSTAIRAILRERLLGEKLPF